VGGLEWRSPADYSRQLSQRFAQPQWQALFPEDEGWMPWVLEVHPVAPLGQEGLIREFTARRQQEGTWKLVLWDGETLRSLAESRRFVWIVGGFALALTGLGGGVALMRLPWPREGGRWLAACSAGLGLLGPASVWLVAFLADGRFDARVLAIALAIGFCFSGFLAPALRLRTGHSISLIVSEEPNERIRQNPRSNQ
jgi:hypothetical protein